jgi:mannose/fructose-specific phosphotransferase system component IIA
MFNCLVITHGDIGQAVIDAASRITGEVQGIHTFGCDGLRLKDMRERIIDVADTLGDGLFILVCVRGGSVWNAAVSVANEKDDVIVISGLNLAMFLSFITKREQLTFSELKDALLEDARRGVSVLE